MRAKEELFQFEDVTCLKTAIGCIKHELSEDTTILEYEEVDDSYSVIESEVTDDNEKEES